MENAVDALKMAFAVIVFTIALSLSIYMFTQARETADAVLYKSGITDFVDYEETQINPLTGNVIGQDRIVGLETIIPTLYKYYKENYTVIFREKSGFYMELYQTQTDTELWSRDYTNKYSLLNNEDRMVCSFDVDEETKRHEPWTGSMEEYKKNLDAFLSGGEYSYTSSTEGATSYKYENFINTYKNTRFRETLGEYVYNDTSSGNTVEKKKRVIIYTETIF